MLLRYHSGSIHVHVSIILTEVVIFELFPLFHNRTRSTLFQPTVLHIYPCVEYTGFLTIFVLNYQGEQLPGLELMWKAAERRRNSVKIQTYFLVQPMHPKQASSLVRQNNLSYSNNPQ